MLRLQEPVEEQVKLLMQLCDASEDVQTKVKCIGALECLAQFPSAVDANRVSFYYALPSLSSPSLPPRLSHPITLETKIEPGTDTKYVFFFTPPFRHFFSRSSLPTSSKKRRLHLRQHPTTTTQQKSSSNPHQPSSTYSPTNAYRPISTSDRAGTCKCFLRVR